MFKLLKDFIVKNIDKYVTIIIIWKVVRSMKKRKGWIIILVVFLIVFGFEFKGVTKEIFTDYTNGNLDKEITLEYSNLTEEEKEEYNLEEYSQLIKKEVTKENLIKEFAFSISIYLLILIGYILFWNSNFALNGFNLGIDNYIGIMVIFFYLWQLFFYHQYLFLLILFI